MVDVTSHVKIQLNLLSHSLCSVDPSLLSRCCLNSELCKLWSLLNLPAPVTVSVHVCIKKKTKKEPEAVSHISDHFTTVQSSLVGGGGYAHTGLILVNTVDHIADSVNLNFAASVLTSGDSHLCAQTVMITALSQLYALNWTPYLFVWSSVYYVFD